MRQKRSATGCHDTDNRRIHLGARYLVVAPFGGSRVPQQWEIVRVLSFVGGLPRWCRVERLQEGVRKTICVTPCSRLARCAA